MHVALISAVHRQVLEGEAVPHVRAHLPVDSTAPPQFSREFYDELNSNGGFNQLLPPILMNQTNFPI